MIILSNFDLPMVEKILDNYLDLNSDFWAVIDRNYNDDALIEIFKFYRYNVLVNLYNTIKHVKMTSGKVAESRTEFIDMVMHAFHDLFRQVGVIDPIYKNSDKVSSSYVNSSDKMLSFNQIVWCLLNTKNHFVNAIDSVLLKHINWE